MRICLYPGYLKHAPKKLLSKWNDEINQYGVLGKGNESVAYALNETTVVVFTINEMKLHILEKLGLLINYTSITDLQDNSKKIYRLVVKRVYPIYYDDDDRYVKELHAVPLETECKYWELMGDNLIYEDILPLFFYKLSQLDFPVHLKNMFEYLSVEENYVGGSTHYRLDWSIVNWFYDDEGQLYFIDPVLTKKQYKLTHKVLNIE